MAENDATGDDKAQLKKQGRINLQIILIGIPWMIVLFWLWSKTGYPESYGYSSRNLHGRAGVFADYWHSYLLLRRPDFWGIILFIWMWTPLVGWIGWIIRVWWKDRRDKHLNFSLFDDDPPPR